MDRTPSTPPSHSLGLFRRATLQARIDALASREAEQPAPLRPALMQPPSETEPTDTVARTA